MKHLLIIFILIFNLTHLNAQRGIVLSPIIKQINDGTLPYVEVWKACFDSLELIYNYTDVEDTNYVADFMKMIVPYKAYVLDAYFVDTNIVAIKTITYVEDFEHPEKNLVGQISAIFTLYVQKNKDQYKILFEKDVPLDKNVFEVHHSKYFDYIYPKGFKFNTSKAKQTTQFLDDIYKNLNISYKKSNYVIVKERGKMYQFLGFEYSIYGTTGIFMLEHNTLLDNVTEGFYKHELVHKAMVDANITNFNKFVNEGLAVALSDQTSARTVFKSDLKEELVPFNVDAEHLRKIIEEEQPYFFELGNIRSYCLAGLFFKSIIAEQGLKQVVAMLKPLQEHPIKEVFQKLLQTSENPYPMVLEHIKKQYQKEFS